MKTLAVTIATSSLALSLVASGYGQSVNRLDPTESGLGIQAEIQTQTALTREEAAGLLFIREEEKLAQNVYSFLAKKVGAETVWKHPPSGSRAHGMGVRFVEKV